MNTRAPVTLISGDVVFVGTDKYIFANKVERFEDDNELNRWIVANIDRLQSDFATPFPEHSWAALGSMFWNWLTTGRAR